MQPIGVFGGTFDPIHCGHLRTAFELWQELQLAEVRFLPTGTPPHRDQLYASPELRLKMVQAAVADQPSFVVDDREVRRSGVSYSVDTLTELRREYPHRSLCLLLGMDAFLGLPHWHRWRELLTLAHIVVAHRPGWRAPTTGPLGRGHGRPRHRRDPHAARGARRPRLRARRDAARDLLDRAARADRRRARSALSGSRSREADHPRDEVLCCADLTGTSRSEILQEKPLKHMTTRTRLRLRDERASPLQQAVTAALDDMKAVNVRVLDVRGLTDIADTMVIASGNSDRHVRSIAERVVEKAKAAGFRPLGTEGARDGEWVLVDLQDIVVHVMLPRVREFYGLERLWDGGPAVSAVAAPAVSRGAARRRTSR